MRGRATAIILLLLLPLLSAAQELHSRNKKAIALYEQARELDHAGNWYRSLDLLKEALSKDDSFDEAIALAHQIMLKRDLWFQADSLFRKLSPKLEVDFKNRILLNGAYYHYAMGNYERASDMKGQIEGEVKGVDHRLYELSKRSIDYALNEKQNPRSVEFMELPYPLNVDPQQYFPSITSNNMLVFTVRKKGGRGDENIFYSQWQEEGWTKPMSISAKINTDRNEGSASISADGRTLVFTACNKPGGKGSCDLYISRREGDDWSKPRLLPDAINSTYWESQPSLTQDGRQLYFISKRPDGTGGQDIWWSRKAGTEWMPAINLGKAINTSFDESSPYIHPDGKTLFFASRGRVGFGGYDLFTATRSGGDEWTEPRNLGYPINTHKNEVGYTISSDGWAYYSENDNARQATIHRFKLPPDLLPETPLFTLSGIVIDSVTEKPLQAAVIVANIATDSTQLITDSDEATGDFKLLMEKDDNAYLYIKKKGYLLFRADMSSLYASADQAQIRLSPLKAGDKVILKNILFQFNSATLDGKATKELDLAASFILENPEVRVEIAGHTDSQGEEAYNLKLSKSRAASVYDYFLKKGVPKENLVFNGYGESRLVVDDSDPNSASLNRRIELIITSIKD